MIKLNELKWDSDYANIVADDCTSDYILHEGLISIPVMGPEDTPPVVVRVHAAYTERRVSYLYARTRVPPLIPTPGDTQSGDIYLGGNIKINAPSQDGKGYLKYAVSGGYNFVSTKDFRSKGKVMFDAHGYASIVDLLGAININPNPKSPGEGEDVWQSPYFDLNELASARILG